MDIYVGVEVPIATESGCRDVKLFGSWEEALAYKNKKIADNEWDLDPAYSDKGEDEVDEADFPKDGFSWSDGEHMSFEVYKRKLSVRIERCPGFKEIGPRMPIGIKKKKK